jgi:ketosteroid isomerase-like protein
MRSILACCVLVSMTAALPARADVCPAVTADQAAVEVRTAFDAWNEAVMRKDLDRTMAIFSQSIRFQFQGAADFGYPRLLTIYTSSFSRENAPQWHPIVENIMASPEMVTLFNEWKLIPAGGGDPISEYRGVDVFQREGDCVWRVTASLNYADKSVAATSPNPSGHSVGPATVDAKKAQPLVAWRETQVRDLDFVFGHH